MLAEETGFAVEGMVKKTDVCVRMAHTVDVIELPICKISTLQPVLPGKDIKLKPLMVMVLAAYADVGERLVMIGLDTSVKTAALDTAVTELGLIMLMRIMQAPFATPVPTANVNEFESIIAHGIDGKKLIPSAPTSAVQPNPGMKFVPVTVIRLFL